LFFTTILDTFEEIEDGLSLDDKTYKNRSRSGFALLQGFETVK
jgi:hypothetical protein